jgi:hypothetical protein
VIRRALPALLVVVLTGGLMYPLCGALFRCGCVGLFAGAADHCNVHAAKGPRCPWCRDQALGAMGFGLTLGGQALAFALVRRRGGSVRASALGAIAALPLAAFLAGGLTFLLTDYPHFLAEGARERIGLPPGPIRTPESP